MKRSGDYELIDAGGRARLERFGDHTVIRPARGAVEPRRAPELWGAPDLAFDPVHGWIGSPEAQAPWIVIIDGITLELRPGAAGQLGFFPEHALLLRWLRAEIADWASDPEYGTARPTVLNLFAGTGLASLALARAGAEVTHVDGSRAAVAAARRNAEVGGLGDAPIRWIAEDAGAFVRREARRGRRYSGVVLDPPSYGHGGGRGRTWKVERDLPELLRDTRGCLSAEPFVLLTTHTRDLPAEDLAFLVAAAFDRPDRDVRIEPLRLVATSGAVLDLGLAIQLAR